MKKISVVLMLCTFVFGMSVASFSVQAQTQAQNQPQTATVPVVKPAISTNTSVKSTKLDINRADLKLLMKVKGIGKRKAQAIIKYRNQHGAFKSLQQLSAIRGVTPALLTKLSDKFEVSNIPQPRVTTPSTPA